MATCIAFLRAINVGGHTVTMSRLRALTAELGFTGVESFIASGNLRFEARGGSRAVTTRLAAHLEASLGYPVPVFLRSPPQVRRLLDQLPRAATEAGVSAYLGFLQAAPDRAAAARLAALESRVDRFIPVGTELLWLCRKTISKSLVTGRQLEVALGQPTTFRSLSSLRRLAAAWCSPG